MRNYYKILPMILLGFVLFLSIGFSSFSSNLLIGDIKASVRPTKNIRVTKFYALEGSNDGNSAWEEYSAEKIVSNISLPNANSSVRYKVEVTNLDSATMMIESISGLPEGLTYELVDYELKDKICSNSDDTICTLGARRQFEIIIKYEDGADIIDDQIVGLDIKFSLYAYKVRFDANGGTGSMDSIDVKYNESATLPANTFTKEGFRFKNWNTAEDGSGTTYTNKQSIYNINTSGENEVVLYAQWEEYDGIYYPGLCIFNGQGNDVEGECAEGKHVDYIDTGIAPFSDENYQRNFVLKYTIVSVSDDSFNSSSRATIFNMLYEINNNALGKFPGSLMRVEGGKWLLQGSHGTGSDYTNKILFTKDDLLNKEFKLIRYNDGESIKLYYMIGNGGPYLLKDITNLSTTFDVPLTFGASTDYIDSDGDIFRYIIATLGDISFEFKPAGTTLEELAEKEIIPDEERIMNTVFSQHGVCTFNGANENITGDSCSLYHDYNYIDTDVRLFSSENLDYDFDVTFNIDSFVPGDQEENQVTLMNAFLERQGTGYGMLLRRARGSMELIIRDGNGLEKKVTLSASTTTSLRIIRVDKNICYSVNNGTLKYAISMENFAAPFSVPLTFGGSISKEQVPFRFIKGELSGMEIKLGKFNTDVQCNESMR